MGKTITFYLKLIEDEFCCERFRFSVLEIFLIALAGRQERCHSPIHIQGVDTMLDHICHPVFDSTEIIKNLVTPAFPPIHAQLATPSYLSPLLPGFTGLLPPLHSGQAAAVYVGTFSVTSDL